MSKKTPQSNRRTTRRDDVPRPKPTSASAVGDADSSPRASPIIPIAALVALTLVTFGSVVGFDFLNWDDNIHVYQNPQLLIGLGGVGYFWTHPYEHLYIPLSYTVYDLLLSIAHLGPGIQPMSQAAPAFDPHVFHVANLALHVANVIGVFLLLRRLNLATIPSALGAALFAVHPFQVESVSWISELRGLLAGFFGIASLNAYVSACRRNGVVAPKPRAGLYVVALVFFISALLSKPSAVTVGLVMICLRAGIQRAAVSSAILEALPFLACAVPITLVSSSVQQGGAIGQDIRIWLRPFVAGDALAFYLAKLFAPVRVAIDYGRKPTAVLAHAWGYLTWIFPVAVGVLLVRYRKAYPEGAAGGAIAVAFLLPVLGLVPFVYQGYSTVADRYMYLAMIGPALALAGALSRAEPSRWHKPAVAVACCAVAVLAAASWAHAKVWRNSLDLYKAALAANPTSYAATTNLGAYYITAQQWSLAIPPLERAVRNDPTDVFSIMDLGDAYRYMGRDADAEATYRKGLTLSPGDAHAHFGLGSIAMRRHRFADAIGELTAAAASDPTLIQARATLGDAYMEAKQYDGAAAAYQAAIDIDPGSVYGWSGLGMANYLRGDASDAVNDFETAIRYCPPAVNGRSAAQPLEAYLAQARKKAGVKP